jgi:hypothetical protein
MLPPFQPNRFSICAPLDDSFLAQTIESIHPALAQLVEVDPLAELVQALTGVQQDLGVQPGFRV